MKVINNILSLCLFFIGLTLVSCKGGEDVKKQDNLMGSWVSLQYDKEECTNETFNPSDVLVCTDRTCTILKLKEDDQYDLIVTENFISQTESGTWVVNGDKLRFEYSEEGVTTVYTREFVKTDDQLVTIERVESTNCLQTTTWGIYTEPEG